MLDPVKATDSPFSALGRVTMQTVGRLNGASWVLGDQTRVEYNAYGEVAKRGVNGLWQEQYNYDKAGRVWKANDGDGVAKLYFYDAEGNQTLGIASSGTDLSGKTEATALALVASATGSASAGLTVTINVYDKRNQSSQTRALFRQTSSSTTITAINSRTYNAFGEVATEVAPLQIVDANGNAAVTTYTYNTLGKLVMSESPYVNWTSDSGAIGIARPTRLNYYDLAGRLIGVRDANGRLSTRTLLAGTGHGDAEALVLKEFHADDGIFERKYNIFGDMRFTSNEIAKTENYVYDGMGRLIEQDHQLRGSVQLKDFYEYDGLGQRTRHWIGQLGTTIATNDIASYVDKTDYDMQGRVISTIDSGGNATSYGYSFDTSLATGSLGTFGAWVKTTTNTAGKAQVEKIDYFGRTIDRVDYGGHDYNFTFDVAGRLTGRTSDAGETATYGYFNSGLIASSATSYDNGGYRASNTTTYRYDAAGQRVFEGYSISGAYTQNTTGGLITYAVAQDTNVTRDALGRMISLNGTTGTGTEPITIVWEYDLNGNIRHMANYGIELR